MLCSLSPARIGNTLIVSQNNEKPTLFPFLPARPCRNVAAKKRFRHEPLKCDTRERMVRCSTLHKPPRLLPGFPVILADLFTIVALFGVEFGQPLRSVAEITVAAEKFPNLGRDLLILVERTRIEKPRR